MATIKDLRNSAEHERDNAQDARKRAQRLLDNFKNYPADADQQKRLNATEEAQNLEQKALTHDKAAEEYEKQASNLESEALNIEQEKQTLQQATQDKLKQLDQRETHIRG